VIIRSDTGMTEEKLGELRIATSANLSINFSCDEVHYNAHNLE
jgi:hypothetical protein